jgi:hypothetical protein
MGHRDKQKKDGFGSTRGRGRDLLLLAAFQMEGRMKKTSMNWRLRAKVGQQKRVSSCIIENSVEWDRERGELWELGGLTSIGSLAIPSPVFFSPTAHLYFLLTERQCKNNK